VNRRRRILVELLLALGILAPFATAQKPPSPPPGPAPSPPPTRQPGSSPSNLPSGPPDLDRVMLLLGQVSVSDGTPVPTDTMVERVCNENVRQQIYAAPGGGFSMQLDSRVVTLLDATADAPATASTHRDAAGQPSEMGIPRSELTQCDLRASAAGFRSNTISLVGLTPSGSAIDVGSIVLHRTAPVPGGTLNAAPYQAPPKALKLFDKGLKAAKNSKLAEAQQYFEKALEIYPKYASAWFQLGEILQKQDQKDSAREAYTQAAALDAKFLAPYLSLAALAFEAADWNEVLRLTGHIADHDPFSSTVAKEYLLDLDELNLAAAYFYNAVANYQLGKIEEAEKSAHKAEHCDLRTTVPQLHVLLAQISTQKKDYATAVSELQAYLDLVPHAKNGDQIREQLARLEELKSPAGK